MDNTYTRKEFIDKYGAFIFAKTKGTGVYPETLISQAILESSGDYNGSWLVGGSKLARESNNFFGIKASSKWKGKTYNIDTGEVFGGKKVVVNADFRAYNSVKDSIKDYIKFLKENPRYANALQGKDYYSQAKELQKAGYATAPNYADTLKGVVTPLIPIIENEYKKFKRNRNLKLVGGGVLFIGTLLLVVYLTTDRKK
jgi:flagellum-specific peptidoglycan hydrolase FlgJ